MPANEMSFGHTLRVLRLSDDYGDAYGVRELSRIVEVAPSHITRLESGKVRPSAELVRRLARALDCHVSALLYLSGNLDAVELVRDTESVRAHVSSWTREDEAALTAGPEWPEELLERLAHGVATHLSLIELADSMAGDDIVDVLQALRTLTPERFRAVVTYIGEQAALSELDRRESKLSPAAGSKADR